MNDFNLLRPFDPEAAKRGEPLVTLDSGSFRKYIAGPDRRGRFVTETDQGMFIIGKAEHYRMAPLGWIEDKPVYRGDKLWHKLRDEWIIADSFNAAGAVCEKASGGIGDWPANLSWTKPERVSTLSASDARRIIKEGVQARCKLNQECPYPPETAEHVLFEKGWQHGEY